MIHRKAFGFPMNVRVQKALSNQAHRLFASSKRTNAPMEMR